MSALVLDPPGGHTGGPGGGYMWGEKGKGHGVEKGVWKIGGEGGNESTESRAGNSLIGFLSESLVFCSTMSE